MFSNILTRFPFQYPLQENVIKSRHQQGQKDEHFDKAKPTELFELNRPGVHEHNFHVEKNKKDGGHEIPHRKWRAGIPHTIQSTFKTGILAFSPELGAKQMGSYHGENNKSGGYQELQDDGIIIEGNVFLWHEK